MTFSLPDDCDWRIRALYDHWRSIHPPSGLPDRQHFDPLDVPRLLGNIWMIDVFRDPLRFRFRLVGTVMVDFMGHDATGKWVDDLTSGPEGDLAIERLRRLVEEKTPIYRAGPPSITHQKDFYRLERVYLPLAGDGVTVDIILGIAVYFAK